MSKVVLIPVLTGKENNKQFLFDATGPAKKVVIVYLIDQKSGLTASEMKQELQEKELVLEEIEQKLRMIGKPVKVYNEWGNLTEKIPVIVKREEVTEVVVLKKGKLANKEIDEIESLKLPLRFIQ